MRCPFCGLRELHEFEFLKTRADPDAAAFGRVYERSSTQGRSVEYWQHVAGCRAWLLLRRDPSTDAVSEVSLLDQVTP